MLGDLILMLVFCLKTIKKYTKRFFCFHKYDWSDMYPKCEKCYKSWKNWF